SHLEYDPAGNVSKATLPDGAVVRATYDSLSRPLSLTRPDKRQIHLAYELGSRRARIVPPGRPAHTDEVNPEARTRLYEPPTLDGTTTSDRLAQHDLEGRLLSLTHGNGEALAVERDNASHLSRVATPRGVFSYEYEPASGHRIGARTPEGQNETYAYDGPLLLGITMSGRVAG